MVPALVGNSNMTRERLAQDNNDTAKKAEVDHLVGDADVMPLIQGSQECETYVHAKPYPYRKDDEGWEKSKCRFPCTNEEPHIPEEDEEEQKPERLIAQKEVDTA